MQERRQWWAACIVERSAGGLMQSMATKVMRWM